jgi:hypothetical protein
MRRALALVALTAVLLGGCSLKKDNSNCTGDPTGAGGGNQGCPQPPPTHIDKLNQ